MFAQHRRQRTNNIYENNPTDNNFNGSLASHVRPRSHLHHMVISVINQSTLTTVAKIIIVHWKYLDAFGTVKVLTHILYIAEIIENVYTLRWGRTEHSANNTRNIGQVFSARHNSCYNGHELLIIMTATVHATRDTDTLPARATSEWAGVRKTGPAILCFEQKTLEKDGDGL